MKILLINPYRLVRSEVAKIRKPARLIHPPLGLGYLASYILNRSGHKAEILDCIGASNGRRVDMGEYTRIGLNDDEIAERVKRCGPDMVGITSSFTAHHKEALDVASAVKRLIPGVKIIFGGMHATMDRAETLKNQSVDIVVMGDGEKVLAELMDCIESGRDYSRIPGTALKKDGKIIVNEMAPPIEDLDSLPFPAFEMLHMDYYLGRNAGPLERFLDEPIGVVMSSRGCPFNCIFCATDRLFKKFRARSAKNVADEIEYLVQKYSVKEIAFQDDCFLASKERVKGICNEIIGRKLNIRWSVPPGMNAWLLDPELLGLMKKSGMYRVVIPVETASKQTLKFIRKSVDLDRTRQIVKQLNRLGIRTSGNFMIGFPYETKENIDETVDYIMKTDFDVISVLICQPLKGSDLYEICRTEGIVGPEPMSGSVPICTRYGTKYFTAEELNGLRQEILKRFVAKRMKSLFTVRGFYYHIACKAMDARNIAYAVKKILKNVLVSRVGVLDILKAK